MCLNVAKLNCIAEATSIHFEAKLGWFLSTTHLHEASTSLTKPHLACSILTQSHPVLLT